MTDPNDPVVNEWAQFVAIAALIGAVALVLLAGVGR